MASAILSSNGWVVIPAQLRKKYRLRAGCRVRVVDYGGIISLQPELARPIEEARGMLKGRTSLTRSLLRQRAKDRRREDR